MAKPIKVSNAPTAEPGASEWPEEYVVARAAGEQFLSTARELADVVARCAEPEGLTSMEARALRYLHDALPQRELAARLGCDAPRVTTITRRLNERGYIRRGLVHDDKRVRLAELTDEGIEAVKRIGERLAAASPVLHGLSLQEARDLQSLLERVSTASRASLRAML